VSAEELTDGEGDDDKEREGREHDHTTTERSFSRKMARPDVTSDAKASAMMAMTMAMLSACGKWEVRSHTGSTT
jgi:hypothetical protein